jgi:hypothetical protein
LTERGLAPVLLGLHPFSTNATMNTMLFRTALSTSCIVLGLLASAQEIDKTKLALDVSAANEANNAKLKSYIWKLKLDGYVNKELKVTTLTEMKFGPDGKLVATPIDAKTTVKAKPGIRGNMQKSAAEDNAEYIQKAAEVMAQYAYMSKGQLVDFFDKATVTSDGKLITAKAQNALQAGDELTILIDPATNLFVRKTFKAKSGADPIEGTVDYATFTTTGINHVAKCYLMMPAKAMQVNTENIDYTQRVQ